MNLIFLLFPNDVSDIELVLFINIRLLMNSVTNYLNPSKNLHFNLINHCYQLTPKIRDKILKSFKYDKSGSILLGNYSCSMPRSKDNSICRSNAEVILLLRALLNARDLRDFEEPLLHREPTASKDKSPIKSDLIYIFLGKSIIFNNADFFNFFLSEFSEAIV